MGTPSLCKARLSPWQEALLEAIGDDWTEYEPVEDRTVQALARRGLVETKPGYFMARRIARED